MRRLALIILVVLALCGAAATASSYARAAAHKHRKTHAAQSRAARLTRLTRRLVSYARQQLGTTYRIGGTSPAYGFDCSGLVYAAYRSVGITVPRTSWEQLRAGRRVSWGGLRAGDLLFTNGGGHVVLVVSRRLAISAPHSGARVRIVPLSAYRTSFYAGRRLLA